MERKPNYTFDFRDSFIPLSMLEVTQVFRDMEINAILEVFVKDLDIQKDILKIIPRKSYKLIFMEELEEGDPTYRIQLKKIK